MVSEYELRLAHLLRVQGLGRRRIRHLIELDPSLSSIYQFSISDLQAIFRLTPMKAQRVFHGLRSPKLLNSVKQDLKTTTIISLNHPRYPSSLKMIPDPPLLLYIKGSSEFLEHEPKLSVVGTRAHSGEARRKVHSLLRPVIERDWLIVSGMAKGIDSFSHQAALTYKGKTIGVLGFGFHHIYPKENIQLMKTLEREHLLISEYPPNAPPKPWHFPERNRIISGLSFGTLVVEAKERSGTFITAEQALEQGREVFVVPGSILLPQTKGCHTLIQEGAQLVHSAEDLIEARNSYENWSLTP
ncbi:DNA-protecting protein DprA [Virgibacillus sp. MSP4-1]|uniref:DNA-processing protein DprA n=1 Tax=Virgibacillus sp. MSP4-1 TaxID=2700081 RepID=UPI000694561F|nr:DNA-processing protein DprA [Virgibacillus sp. MSP4-1]QHS22236.1 DNA-protecting protein DprA [Virgibacillus sp. MSP4-1]